MSLKRFTTPVFLPIFWYGPIPIPIFGLGIQYQFSGLVVVLRVRATLSLHVPQKSPLIRVRRRLQERRTRPIYFPPKQPEKDTYAHKPTRPNLQPLGSQVKISSASVCQLSQLKATNRGSQRPRSRSVSPGLMPSLLPLPCAGLGCCEELGSRHLPVCRFGRRNTRSVYIDIYIYIYMQV